MGFSVQGYYDGLVKGDVVYAFKGSITSETINTILESVEQKLDEKNEDPKIRKKIYNVLVESLQNLFHHIDEVPLGLSEKVAPKLGIVVVKKTPPGYEMLTGNFVSNHKTSFLEDKINKINSLTKEELKDMYKFILNHQKLSAKGGGGLGLVDIARKTGTPLEYTFEQVNPEFSFYVFKVEITE